MSVIVAAIVGYIVAMFFLHEIFKKFFHTVLFLGFLAFAAIAGYIIMKGG
ncbi:MAG: hypothetical protein AABX32_04790 [Nanoarchaeota archaeon]